MTDSPFVIIETGACCENNCYFCTHKSAVLPAIKASIRDKTIQLDQNRGASQVVICGLEPLSDPHLIQHIQSLKQRGASRIRLETNGIRLEDNKLVTTLARAGVTEISIVLPAVSDLLYEKITQNPRGLQACLKGLKNISACRGIEAHCTVPVCRENAFHLVEILDFLKDLNLLSVLLDISGTHGFWPAGASASIMNHISKAVSHGVTAGIPVSLKGTQVHQVSSFADGRFIREKHDESLLLTYFRPGRNQRRQLFSLDIRLTYQCNERCVFCAAHLVAREPDPAIIRRRTKSLFARGVPRLCLEGGEPTLSPLLPELLRAARKNLVRERIVMTNALRLAEKSLAREIFQAGANRFFVSLHGHTRDIADAITQTPGAFQKTVSGIHNLLELGAATSLIFVMTASNLDSLPAYVRFVSKEFGPIPLLLSVASPYLSPALDSRVIPSYENLRTYMTKAFKIADNLNLPISAMEEQHRPPECAFPGTNRFFRNLFAPVQCGPEMSGFIKPDRCARCSRTNVCPGIKDFYAKAHGTREIQPIVLENALS